MAGVNYSGAEGAGRELAMHEKIKLATGEKGIVTGHERMSGRVTGYYVTLEGGDQTAMKYVHSSELEPELA